MYYFIHEERFIVKKPREPGGGIASRILIASIIKILSRSNVFATILRKFITISEVLEYLQWLERNFGRVQIDLVREQTFNRIKSTLTQDLYMGLEFGVAWGRLTHWWFKNTHNRIYSWHGFDTFTGLPQEWRNFERGHFDAKGLPPVFSTDSRIVWHVGDVANTIQFLQIDPERDYSLIVFFDFDLFEPSLVAWNKVVPALKVDDILYFDEAFDSEERRLLNDYVLRSGTFKFIGASIFSLALQVQSIRQ
jgi:hypothetical protein